MEDQDICDILIETYNVNKFDNATKELKDAVYEEAKKCSETHEMEIYEKKGDTIPVKSNKRDILMKLIENHFDPNIQQPMPQFIAGPTTLTVHKSPDEKRMIYIFGESHSDIKDCRMFKDEEDEKWNNDNPDKMTIDHFLYELMKTTSAYLDIYFEFIFPEIGFPKIGFPEECHNGPINSHMDNLFQKFKKCIHESRSKDDCSLARVHYFDSRRRIYNGESIQGSSIVDKLIEKINYFKIIYNHAKLPLIQEYKEIVRTDDNMHQILYYLWTQDEEEFKDFWIKLLDNELNIKQTKSGKYEDRATTQEIEIMTRIKSFMETEIVRIAMKYREIYTKLTYAIVTMVKERNEEDELFYDAFEVLIEYITKPSARIADVYLLARLFKDFDMTKMNTHANDVTDQPAKAYNVIIYAGDSHSETYRSFLKDIAGFEEIASSGKFKEGEIIKHCIDMRRIPQPFFSTWTRTPTKEEEE
jgi:hypothetical protein